MKRNIPTKNYISLTLIFVITILLTLFLRKIYINSINNDRKGLLPEINISELSSYVQENPDIMIYISYNNEDDKKIEAKLQKYLIKNNIKYGLIYVDLNNVTDEDVDNINKKYLSESLMNSGYKLKKYSNLIYVDNGLAADIMYTDEKSMNYNDIINFLKKHEVAN